MCRKILAVVNEHVNSEIAARYALYFAKQANARVCFCSIGENKGIAGEDFRMAKEAVKRLSARVRELGVPSECIFKTGDPFAQLGKVMVAENIGLVFACRSSRESLFTTKFFTNKLIFAGIAVELVLQLFIIYHSLGNKVFSTAPIPPGVWLVIIPFAVLLLTAEEVRKLVMRRFRPL